MSDTLKRWKDAVAEAQTAEAPDLRIETESGRTWLLRSVRFVSVGAQTSDTDEPPQGERVKSLTWFPAGTSSERTSGPPHGHLLADYLVDGHYQLDGEHYETPEDLLIALCEAGDATDSAAYLEYVLGGLEVFAHLPDARPFQEWYDEHEARILAHHGSDGAAQHFRIWALAIEFVDYGANIKGAWLTTSGEKVLALLREWKASQ